MAVYIPDLEMPEMCRECPCASVEYHIWACDILKLMLTHDEVYVKRREDCPMVSIPPHGDLIDGNALAALFRSKVEGDKGIGTLMVKLAALCIDNAPVVIPADKEEDG